MNEAQRIAALEAALPRLNESSRNFAMSLLFQYRGRGNLSARQWPHVDALIERAHSGDHRSTTNGNALPTEGVNALQACFANATARGQRAAVTVPLAGFTYRIATPSATSSYAGRPVMFVRRGGVYAGRIEGGQFHAGRGVQDTPATVAALTELFAANPLAVMAAIGRRTGTCCFCARELTDPRSVHHGYGPICAGHYGLPWDGNSDTACVIGTPPVFLPGDVAALVRARGASNSRPPQPLIATRAAVSNAAPVPPDQLDDEDREFMGGAL